VSGTGLFKASFPWATKEQEAAEKRYIKQLPGTDAAEVAGNVWVRLEASCCRGRDIEIGDAD
jgi:hypothetical protein